MPSWFWVCVDLTSRLILCFWDCLAWSRESLFWLSGFYLMTPITAEYSSNPFGPVRTETGILTSPRFAAPDLRMQGKT